MAFNTVKLKNYGNVFVEYEANAEIKPGMLVELMSTGKIRAHSTEDGDVLTMFALENYLEGKEIKDAYAAGDKVQCWIPGRGDEVYAQVADEENISIGDFLTSNGDGYLKKFVPDEASEGSAKAQVTINPTQVVGIALENLNLASLSAAGSSDSPVRAFCKIRII